MTLRRALLAGSVLIVLAALSGCLSNPDVTVSGKTTVQVGTRTH